MLHDCSSWGEELRFFRREGGGVNEVGSGKLQYEVATPEVIKRENTALR